MKTLIRVLAWGLAGLAGLCLLALGWVLYLTYSFDTETPPERQGQFDLALHAQPEPGRPLIVTLGGAEGGNMWEHPRWDAQRQRFLDLGFNLLTVAYFGTPTTPATLDRIDLGALMAKVRAEMARPEVASRCLVLLGGSKGAEMSLAMAAHFADIDAVVAMSPADTMFPAHTEAMTTGSWSLDGQPLPFAPFPWSAVPDLVKGDIGAAMRQILAQPEAAAARIPTERSQARMLLIASEADEMWPALTMARRIEALHPERVDLLAVPGDHRAVVEHMDAVEAFLRELLFAPGRCAAPSAG